MKKGIKTDNSPPPRPAPWVLKLLAINRPLVHQNRYSRANSCCFPNPSRLSTARTLLSALARDTNDKAPLREGRAGPLVFCATARPCGQCPGTPALFNNDHITEVARCAVMTGGTGVDLWFPRCLRSEHERASTPPMALNSRSELAEG